MWSLARPELFAVFIPIVGAVCLFTFLTVASYAEERRKEREAYYRYEMRKKALEHGMSAETMLEMQRHEEQAEQRRRREGLKLGGLVTAGVGVGVLFGLSFVTEEAVYMIGYIPLAIGVAIFVYGQWMSPTGVASRGNGPGGPASPPSS
jgi:hypothetical protein